MEPNDQNRDRSVDENIDTKGPVTDAAPGAPVVPEEPTVIKPSEPEASPATVADPATDAPVSAPQAELGTDPGEAAQPQAVEQPAAPSPAPSPAEQVAAPAAVAAVGSSPKKGKKKLMVLLVAVVVALLLIGGVAGAYFGIYVPNQPQKITADALANTANSEKLKSTGFEGEVAFEGGEVSKAISSVSFAGAYDMKARSADVNVSVNTVVTKIALDVRTTDGKSVYLKVSGLDGLDKLLTSLNSGSGQSAAAMSQFAPIIAQVNNQWFVIDEALINQATNGTVPQAGGALSEADAKKIGDIYKKHQFLNIDKRLADETIHGVSSYHVQATINKAQLKSFLQELKAANIKDLKLEQKDIDAIDKVDFSKYPFEMWVSKKDRLITQFSTKLEENGTTFKVRVALKDINKAVSVEKPANAKSVLELMSGLYGGGAGAASPTGAPSPLLMGL